MVPGGPKCPPGGPSLGKRLNLSVSVLSSEEGDLYKPRFPSCWEKVIKSSRASRSCATDIRARQQDTEWAQGPVRWGANPSSTASETCDSGTLPGPSACLNCGAEMLKLLPRELLNLHRAPTGVKRPAPWPAHRELWASLSPAPATTGLAGAPGGQPFVPSWANTWREGLLLAEGSRRGLCRAQYLILCSHTSVLRPKAGVAAGVNSAVLRSHWAHQAGVWTLVCACLPPPPARAAG